METSLSKIEMAKYLSIQLNNHFPDNNKVLPQHLVALVEIAYEKLRYCLSATIFDKYRKNGKVFFDHLYSDSFMLFLCYFANTAWHETKDRSLSSKIYYLNKAMNSFDCMYDTNLPEIFLIIHGNGTIMGKAEYGNYFVIYQGCTIGASQGHYPKIGNGVSIAANCSVIGKCNIGDRSTISLRTMLMRKDIPSDHTAFLDVESGKLQILKSPTCYAQQYFNVDLKNL